MENWIIDCERAYYRSFCKQQSIPGGVRFFDPLLPDMYDHNFIMLDAAAPLTECFDSEVRSCSAAGAEFCKAVIPQPLERVNAEFPDAVERADEAGELLVYEFPRDRVVKPVRGDIVMHKYSPAGVPGMNLTRQDMRALLLVSDAEQFEPGMDEFLENRLARREKVYLADGSVDSYLCWLQSGEFVGSCDALVCPDGSVKFEDFQVRPEFQHAGIGSAMLAGLMAMHPGAAHVYVCTEADDTAWQMYEKFGFVRAGEFTVLMKYL